MGRSRTGTGAALALCLVALAGAAEAGAATTKKRARPAAPALRIETLSNRADLVSGGDVLLAVTVPAKARALRVTIDGRDVTGALARRGDGRRVGLVDGLRAGDNRVVAKARNARTARLTVRNHPIGGPVFAGPQVGPWQCTTADHGLGRALDEQCNAPTQTMWLYKPRGGGSLRTYDPSRPPSDVATTTTDQGRKVPFVIRFEQGTIDRGIYQLAVVSTPGEQPAHDRPPEAWNGKLVVPFGGGCGAHYKQTVPESLLDERVLGRGFMITSNGLNTLQQNCNEVVSAEALMMAKEHIRERYGPIRFTIGRGGSGGAIQQHNIAASYPGLLDGILPEASFADMITTAQEVYDCQLLTRYYTQTSPLLWVNLLARAAVEGHANVGSSCLAWVLLFGPATDPLGRGPLGLPLSLADCAVPAEQKYHPQTNPGGVKCDVLTYNRSLYGMRADGLVNHPYDNVGVQYGLDALKAGAITPEQFVDLNEKIGHFDENLELAPGRAEADPPALATAYATSRVSDARQLANVPILDLRAQNNEEIHQSYYSYTVRARLDAANGTHANQVIWTGVIPVAGDSTMSYRGFLQMDRWLTAIERDRSDRPPARKVIANKPAGLTDACWLEGRQLADQNTCKLLTPYFSNPRIVAGAPWTNDVLKCELRPLDRDDYPVAFGDGQWGRLQRAFPTGVCDHRRPGVAQGPSTPWTTFAGGPGGRPLGAPPRSKAAKPKKAKARKPKPVKKRTR